MSTRMLVSPHIEQNLTLVPIKGYLVSMMAELSLYEGLFSMMKFTLPFNDFEFGVINHLGISPS